MKWRGVPVWSHEGIVCTGEKLDEKALKTLIRAAVAFNQAKKRS